VSPEDTGALELITFFFEAFFAAFFGVVTFVSAGCAGALFIGAAFSGSADVVIPPLETGISVLERLFVLETGASTAKAAVVSKVIAMLVIRRFIGSPCAAILIGPCAQNTSAVFRKG
jgi:hypothetical protein